MKRNKLGSTDIEVSKLCFGSLTMTPFQANLSYDEGAELIKYAYDRGINFIDTAEIYENYEYIRRALKLGIDREDFVITTKTYAYTREMAEESLNKALKALDTDYIDIFLLHEQESIHTVRGHWEAVEYFIEAKERGLIRAIGLSTHRISGVEAVIEKDELEIIHPIINKEGIGIQDGSRDEMLEAIELAHEKGKGIYSMKPIGGGHLISKAKESLEFVNDITSIDAIAIGMQSKEEILANISTIKGETIDETIESRLRTKKRKLIVADYCIGCGSCVRRCRQNGISLIDGKATPNDNCILCGYCAGVCPEFCIKVI